MRASLAVENWRSGPIKGVRKQDLACEKSKEILYANCRTRLACVCWNSFEIVCDMRQVGCLCVCFCFLAMRDVMLVWTCHSLREWPSKHYSTVREGCCNRITAKLVEEFNCFFAFSECRKMKTFGGEIELVVEGDKTRRICARSLIGRNPPFLFFFPGTY